MSKKIKALIVDDEELARSDLRALLSTISSVDVVAEADNIETAAEHVATYSPDVIFLDIQFPRESGFDLLEKIDSPAKIIFVTAFDKYAIRAFEVNALDYLIKPVDPERLALTIDRIHLNTQVSQKQNKFNYNDSVFIEHAGNFYFIKIDSIITITAEGAYTQIVTSKGHKIMAHKSMKEWETRLPENTFVRVHRSTIVNIEFINKIDRWFNYSFRIYLKNIEKPIAVSRRYFSAIKERMG